MMGGSFNGGHVMELRVRSDAEKKVWEEKIMQQDKLSSVMGEYLLKGYRMLDSYCDDCGNILMSCPERSGRNTIFCLQCLQAEGKGKGDDTTVMRTERGLPAVSTIDAASVLTTTTTTTRAASDIPTCDDSSSTIEASEAMQSAQKVLLLKLVWATQELERSSSVEYCTQLTKLIQNTCLAIKQLKDM